MLNEMWWEKDEEKCHKAIFDTVSILEKRQEPRLKALLAFYRLYGNQEYTGFDRKNYNRTASKHRLTFNLIRSLVDTSQSMVCAERILPMVLTNGGSYDERKLGEKATDFIYGAFTKAKFFSTAEETAHHAALFGTGWGKHVPSNGMIRTERVFPGEIFLDDQETMEGEPTVLYQKKTMAKYHLMKMFPEKKDFIKNAGKPDITAQSYRPVLVYMSNAIDTYTKGGVYEFVDVIEAWHLPSSPGAKDGRHAICLDNATLLDERYKKSKFPFDIMRYQKGPLGYLGSGIAEMTIGIQAEINEILKKIQHLTYMLTPKILASSNTVMNEAHLNNDNLAVLNWSGAIAPQMFQLGFIPPELLQMLNWNMERGYEQCGISFMAAQSQKPAGLNSRPALLTMNNIESKRHIIFGREYSDFHVDSAETYLGLAGELGDYEVLVPKSNIAKRISFKELADLDLNNVIYQVYPKNLLSKEPAGRLEQIDMMLQMGLIMPEDGRRLLDFPDLKSTQTLYDSKVDVLETIIETMMETREFIMPDPVLDLEWAVPRMTMHYQQGLVEGLDEERMSLIRDWIEIGNDMINKAAQAKMMEQQAMAGQMMPPPQNSNVVPMGI